MKETSLFMTTKRARCTRDPTILLWT